MQHQAFLQQLRDLLWPQWLRRAGWEYAIILRCCVALFGCILLLIIRPSLSLLGFTAFLPIIFLYLKPPADPILIWSIHIIFGGVVVMATWGWCVLGFKIANVVRDHELDRQVANQIIAAQHLQSPPSNAQILGILTPYAFKGAFVQPKPSAIWGAFIFINVFLVWLIRAYRIRYFFIMVMAGILVLIYGTIGPLAPAFAPIEIGRLYLVPFGEYLAMASFCVLAIFPTSVAGTMMRSTQALVQHKIDILSHVVSTIAAAEETKDPETLKQHLSDRHAELTDLRLAGEQIRLKRDPITNYLVLEPSWSRFSSFHALQYWKAQQAINISLQALLLFSNARIESFQPEVRHDSTFKEKLGETNDTALNILKAAIGGLEVNKIFCHSVSPFVFSRTLSRSKQQEIRQKVLEARKELDAQVASAEKTIASIEEAIRENLNSATPAEADSTALLKRHHVDRVQLRGLLAMAADVDASLAVLLHLLEQPRGFHWRIFNIGASQTLEELVLGTSHPAPIDHKSGSFMNLARALFRLEQSASEPMEDHSNLAHHSADATTSDLEKASHSRYPYPPTGTTPEFLQRSGKRADILHVLTSPQVLLTFKVAVLAVALSVPAFIKANNSAGFYYEQKGLWAAVTAVFATHMFAGETLFGFVARIFGTLVGAVVGLVCWYISTGSGRGNPYGLAVITTLVFSVMVPYRLYSANFIVAVTVTTTATLVVGYSWIDAQLDPPFNPGYGWDVAWRRFVVSSIGLVAGFIVGSFPQPTSVHTHVCRILGSTNDELGRLLSLGLDLASNIASGEVAATVIKGDDDKKPSEGEADNPAKGADDKLVSLGGMGVMIYLERDTRTASQHAVSLGFSQILSIRRKLAYNRQRLALTKLEYTRHCKMLPHHDDMKAAMDRQMEACDSLGLFLFYVHLCTPEEARLVLAEFAGEDASTLLQAALQSILRTSLSLRTRRPYRDNLLDAGSQHHEIPTHASEKILAAANVDPSTWQLPSSPTTSPPSKPPPPVMPATVAASLSALISALHCVADLQRLTQAEH